MGRTERRLNPEFGEREREAAQGGDCVDDDRRIHRVRGLDDRFEGVRDAGRRLVVNHRDGLRRSLERLSQRRDVGARAPV